MISRIDHVSIAVRDRQKAERFFREVLGAVAGAGMEDPGARFHWQIYSLGDLSRLELISPAGEGGLLGNFLRDREGGVHHLTLQTPDLAQAMARLEAEGIPYFGHHAYPGGVWQEIFIHPRHAFGVLIQIAEFRADDWLAEAVRFPPGTTWAVAPRADGLDLTVAHPGGGRVTLALDRAGAAALRDALDEALGADREGRQRIR